MDTETMIQSEVQKFVTLKHENMQIPKYMSEANLIAKDSDFLAYLRSLSILIIVFGHVGGFWIFRPYSEFLHVFVPVFFFMSGAVSTYSFNRSSTIKEYYLKRFTGLLIPYYLLCALLLLLYIIEMGQLPPFTIGNVIGMLHIAPLRDIFPFAIGHVWFLHTLFVILLLSPLYFYLFKKKTMMLIALILLITIFSGIQLFFNIDDDLILWRNNFYKPIIHSVFFIFGIIWVSLSYIRNAKVLIIMFILFITSSILSVTVLNLKIDYYYHVYAPDFYYVSGSFSAIVLLLIFQIQIVTMVKKITFVEKSFRFFHKHTFSIFLLHGIAIHFTEFVPGLFDPPKKTILYGFIKLSIVLMITCVLSVPFTYVTTTVRLRIK